MSLLGNTGFRSGAGPISRLALGSFFKFKKHVTVALSFRRVNRFAPG